MTHFAKLQLLAICRIKSVSPPTYLNLNLSILSWTCHVYGPFEFRTSLGTCPSGSFMVDMGISSNIMKSPFPKCYMTFWDMTMYNDTLNWSDITPICEVITELDFITDLTLLPNFGGFSRTLQRVRLANRGRLLLRTPGPVPFGTCICSNVETILSWTCHVYGPFEFRTSLGTSILLSNYTSQNC